MVLKLSMIAENRATEKDWAKKLDQCLSDYLAEMTGQTDDTLESTKIEWTYGEAGKSEIVFLDGAIEDLDSVLEKIDRRGRSLILIVENDHPRSVSDLLQGVVDDVLVFPFRALEVISKVRYAEQLRLWGEVNKINASFADLLKHLQSDLQLAERLQKLKAPKRFSKVKGFQIEQRFLAGMRSGGDHFDIAESKDGSVLSFLYFHTTSYGLSGAILSLLMKSTLKLTTEQMGKAGIPSEVIRQIQTEIRLTLGAKDTVSVFFGVYHRDTQFMRYVNLGRASVFFGEAGETLELLPSHGEPITQTSKPIEVFQEGCVKFEQGSRWVLASEGLATALGGAKKVGTILNRLREETTQDSVTEMVFQVKSKLDKDELPAQDCTGVVLDMSLPSVRLAKLK